MAKRVAVLGASSDRRKFGNKAVRAYLQAGWEVEPVNLSGGTIEDLPVRRSLADVPPPIDRITVYLHPVTTLAELERIAACGPGDVWFNPGSADAEVLQAARRLGLPFVDGCSIVDIGLSPALFP